MGNAAATWESFAKYEKILAAALAHPPAFVPESESESAVQVERAAGQPAVERLIQLSTRNLAEISVVDRTGHRRAEYRPLMVYAWLRATEINREHRWEEALGGWVNFLAERLESLPISEHFNSASNGAIVAEAAWSALALHVAGELFSNRTWCDSSTRFFERLARGRQKSGALLFATTSDNPETHWYHELVILHALASYAAVTGNRAASDAVLAATEFHLAETQPDHATHQPWALFAFIWNPRSQILADGLLHSCGVMSAAQNRPSGVSLILLADALYSLRLF